MFILISLQPASVLTVVQRGAVMIITRVPYAQANISHATHSLQTEFKV